MTVRVNVRWGHLDRMPKCRHGRVVCSSCEDEAKPSCRWCGAQVFPNTPCACDRAQEEARRIRGGDR